MAGARSEHFAQVDRVKGVAILMVVAIHAKIAENTLIHEQLVNRAVPIFLLVFGMMSDASYRRARGNGRSIGSWYWSRFQRLYVPIWAMAALFWLAVLYTRKPPLPIGGYNAVLTFLGYSPWIGPSWFVTLVIQLVLVFPALYWAADRLGPWLMLPLSAAITAYCAWHSLDVVDFGLRVISRNVLEPGWFYIWVFLPRSLWLVVAGMFVNRLWSSRPGVGVTLGAVAVSLLVLPAIALGRPDEFFFGTLRKLVIMHLFDVPVAVAVLGAMTHLRLPAALAWPLEWCGRHSWGLYLGHVVVFEIMHMYGHFPEVGPSSGRWLYGLFLFLAGATLTVVGEIARRSIPDRLRTAS
jgi:peptidoglycan/LPS O-acetylase OafA/YrhL